MVDPTFSCDVEPGKKSNDGISFSSGDMEKNGVSTIGVIEFSFHVFDPETYEGGFDSDVVVIETSAAGSVPAAAGIENAAILEQDGIVISFVGFEVDDWGDFAVKFCIENNTETAITVQARDVSLNGFMLDGTMSADVMPGKISNTSLSFFGSSLQENGIENVEEAELKFHIFDKDTSDTILDTEAITLTA